MDGPGLANIAAGIDFHLPQFDSIAWLQFTVLIVTLIFCGVASAAETAFTSISRIKLKNLVEEGDKKAAEIEHLLSEPNKFLSTILVVNSVAVIIASSLATILALRFSSTYGELLSSIVISLVVLIFCEITPKTAAVQNPLRWARVLINPLRGTAWLLQPVVITLSVITTFLVRLLGGQVKHHGPFVTEEELRLLVTVGEEEGVLEEDETDMIHSIFEFADTTVREVMVPRIDMVTLDSNATVTQAVDLALQGGFSRIPVYEESIGIDEIIGVLYTKDMLKQLREGHNTFPIRDLVRPAYFVPESKKLDDLLREIRQRRIHMVMVVDEYGSVAGLVTIEDLVEEIVGDIQDEYDHEEVLYEKVNDNEYIFDAKINIYEFSDMMDVKLEEGDYETLGGFVYEQLDKIPVAGDNVTYKDLKFTVLETRGRRINKIRVERIQPAIPQLPGQGELRLLPSLENQNDSQRQSEQDQHSSDQPSPIEYRGA
jgi:CBS domain containing-hemolysin-like protein